jgi:hypothetical protein
MDCPRQSAGLNDESVAIPTRDVDGRSHDANETGQTPEGNEPNKAFYFSGLVDEASHG